MVQLVQALRYKPAGRGFDSRPGNLDFFFIDYDNRVESTRDVSWWLKAAGAYA